MNMTRAVSFVKPRVGLLFFITYNRLIYLLPIYNIVSLVI